MLEHIARNGIGDIGPDQIVLVRMPEQMEKASRLMPQVKECCTDAVITQLLKDEQFNPHVIAAWIKSLRAKLSPKVRQDFTGFVNRVWGASQGNWASLTAIATVFDQKFRTKGDATRTITPELIEEVFNQLARVPQVWQDQSS